MCIQEVLLEDVLVQVNHLIFPADFYVLDMDEGGRSSTPLLLGRPFMSTARTKIDVCERALTMEFEGDVISFNISETLSSQGMETQIKGTCIPLKKSVEDSDDLVVETVASLETLNKDRGRFSALSVPLLIDQTFPSVVQDPTHESMHQEVANSHRICVEHRVPNATMMDDQFHRPLFDQVCKIKINQRNDHLMEPYYKNIVKSTVEEVPLHAVPPDFGT